MRIAYFSPLNPVKSGISDYSEEILPFLNSYFDIDLFIDPSWEPENSEIRNKFNIIPFNTESFDSSKYDEIVYHMGNDYKAHKFIYESLMKYPGIVVLHDLVLQGFYAERYDETRDFDSYKRLLVKNYKQKGVQIAERVRLKLPNQIWESEKAIDYPLNEEVLKAAKAVVVHSEFVKDRVCLKTDNPVTKINQHGYINKKFDVENTRKNLGLEKKDILICSAGFINKNKRYERILSALSEIKEFRFKYLIAGKDRGRLLDNYLNGTESYIIKLGHLPIEKVEEILNASDICINLRYPTMGESSASLLRMMGYAKPTLITDYGSYAEFPDYCAVKISPDIDEKEMIKRTVTALALDKDFRLSMGREAKNFVEQECSIKKCAQEYAGFIKSLQKKRAKNAGE
ncbi:MAG TPA: glycosyltransferase family 4 protein [Acidobacteriota bacterium]|nr:glycosyltransferase family 4 protein [Acidobacteriota bacterium]